jgi:hypothetical protein
MTVAVNLNVGDFQERQSVIIVVVLIVITRFAAGMNVFTAVLHNADAAFERR